MDVVHPILTADSQTEIGVRHIQPSDRERWLALRCQLWPDESEDQLAEDTVRYFAEPERRGGMMPEAVLVAVQLGEAADLVVGFAELSRRMYAEGCESSPVGFLEGWFVIPSLRGRGVGRALVKAGEEWARTVGCREFASDTTVDNVDSAAAHRALGFEEVEVIRCFRKDLD